MKNKKYFYLIVSLVIIAGGVFLTAGQVKAALLCLPPTPLAPTINKLTGEVTLWWQPQMAVTSYTIEVYSGSSLTPIKSYTVDGKTNTMVIPDADLACGGYQYRVKAECCDERCDSCSSLLDPKKDYCSNMASLWQTPCGCPDTYYSGAVPYSFYSLCSSGSLRGYFCADGTKPTGGTCADQSSPTFRDCLVGDKIMGCDWECSPRTHYEPKKCSSEYEVACGEGPNKQLVSGTPSYNLCSIKDPTGWTFNNDYLIPPGVSESLPPLLYQWKCGAGVKISEQCLACRRAECGPPQGKSFQGELPTGQLCLDATGQPTGDLANLTPTDEGWIWDCQGRTECGDNKNWVKYWNGETKDPTPNAWKQLAKCWATKASCGQANGGFYVRENFAGKSTAKDFLCRGGKAVGMYSPDKPYDEDIYFEEKNFSKIISDRMVWKCVYNQGTPEEASIPCEANVVGCRSDITGNDYTKGSFDSLVSDVPAPANLCYNGKDDNANDSQVTLGGPTDRLTPPGWDWTCSDTHGGTANCQADLVECKTPPHDREYKDEKELMAQAPLCTAGESMDFIETATGWTWKCKDDIGGTAKCEARLLKCLTPPNTGVYESWDDMTAKTAANCPGTTNTRTCTGVCSNKDSKISVTFANGKWSWTCGSDSCSAKELACQEPPDKGSYVDWQDFINIGGAKCAGTDEKTKGCDHVCNDLSKWVPEVTYNPDTSQFIWFCGKKECKSQPMGCGNFTAQLHPYSEFKDYQPTSEAAHSNAANPDAICLGDGVPVWYSAYQGETGFTPWGLGEWSDNNPFVDHDASDGRYKEGSWLWQCKYGEKILPATGATGNVYKNEKDGQTYCYVWDKGVCNDAIIVGGSGNKEGQNNNKFTLNEIKTMASDAQTRGNKSDPPLCTRGIVYNGFNGPAFSKTLNQSPFSCGVAADGQAPDHCAYWCENGMIKGLGNEKNCDIDVAACRKPPHGEIYDSEQGFNDAYKEGLGGCEKGSATNLVFNDSTCTWTWQCDDNGYFGCFANKATSDLTATLTGPVPDIAGCSANENDQTVTATTNCSKANTQITWTITSPLGKPKTIADDGTGIYKFSAMSLYNIFDPKEIGIYKISYHLVCNDKCLKGDIKEKDAGPVSFTVDTPAVPTLNIVPSDISFCSKEPTTYNAVVKNCTPNNTSVSWALTQNSTPISSGSGSSFTPPVDLFPNLYTLTATSTCNDICADPKTVTLTRDLEVKQDKTAGVKVDSAKPEFCSKEDLSFTATDLTNPPCDGQVSYNWLIDGQAVSDSDGNDTTLNVPASPYKQGIHTVKVNLTCADQCAKPKPVSAQTDFTIKPGLAPEMTPILGVPTFCANEQKEYTTTFKNCDQGTVAWTLTDSNGQKWGEGSGLSYLTPPNLPVGDYTLMAILTCEDLCADPETVTQTKSLTVESVKQVDLGLSMTEASDDGAACTKEMLTFVADDLTKPTPCSDRTIEWFVDGVKQTGQSGLNFSTDKLAEGDHIVTVTLICGDKCRDKDSVSRDISVTVYNCTCGTANGKNFVDIDNRDPFQPCNKGGVVDPANAPILTGLQWTWNCLYGKKSVGPCTANKTECGLAAGVGQIYTKNSWNTLNTDQKCKNGRAITVKELDNFTEPNENNSCTNAIDDTREWSCQDDAGQSTPTCSNKILDCGIADASRFLTCGKIQPYNSGASDLYSGSYFKDTGVPLDHRCNWGGSFDYKDTTRGKWWWGCQDSLGDIAQCEARRDCGWAVRNQTDTKGNVGDNSKYATVDYGTAGCWTAEDVGVWDDNNTKAMVWGRATRFRLDGNDNTVPACALSPLWTNCRRGHCYPLSIECNKQGVCPDTFFVPEDVEWNDLEKTLGADPDNNCVRDLTKLAPLGGGYQCLPAGNDGDTMPDDPADDGLKDKITFNGAPNFGYWTRSPKSNPLSTDFCPTATSCIRTLPYYQLNSTDTVGRAAGVGDNISCNVNSGCLLKQVRCIKPFTGSGSAGGGGGGKQCYGWGCGLN